MVIAYTDENECDFAIKIEDARRADEVEECMLKGIDAWYCATDPNKYEGDDFTNEEIESFYWSGYAEPTYELLAKKGIAYEAVDIGQVKNGEVTVDRTI